MVLGKLQEPGCPNNLDNGRARAYCVYSSCKLGLFGHFLLSSIISLFFLPVSGKQPTKTQSLTVTRVFICTVHAALSVPIFRIGPVHTTKGISPLFYPSYQTTSKLITPGYLCIQGLLRNEKEGGGGGGGSDGAMVLGKLLVPRRPPGDGPI